LGEILTVDPDEIEWDFSSPYPGCGEDRSIPHAVEVIAKYPDWAEQNERLFQNVMELMIEVVARRLDRPVRPVCLVNHHANGRMARETVMIIVIVIDRPSHALLDGSSVAGA